MWFGESVFKCHWVENVNWVTAPRHWPAVFCGRLRTSGLILGIEDVTGSSQGRMRAKRKRIATLTGKDICRLLKASFPSACLHSCLRKPSTSLWNRDAKGEVKLVLSITSGVSLLRIPLTMHWYLHSKQMLYTDDSVMISVGENKLKGWKKKVLFNSSTVWKTERSKLHFRW